MVRGLAASSRACALVLVLVRGAWDRGACEGCCAVNARVAASPRAGVRAERVAVGVEPEPALNVEPGPVCGRSRGRGASRRIAVLGSMLGRVRASWGAMGGALARKGCAEAIASAATRPPTRLTRPRGTGAGLQRRVRGRAARRSAFGTIVARKEKKVTCTLYNTACSR